MQSADHSYVTDYAQEVMMIIAYFDTMPCNLKLLDFGMGRGTWCQVAKSLGCDIYGFEIAKSEIRYAESHGIQ